MSRFKPFKNVKLDNQTVLKLITLSAIVIAGFCFVFVLRFHVNNIKKNSANSHAFSDLNKELKVEEGREQLADIFADLKKNLGELKKVEDSKSDKDNQQQN